MLFVVHFEDNPGFGDIRQKHMAEHLAFAEAHAANFKALGPLMTPEGEGAGGMWLIEAKDAAEVRALVEADPFYPTGLRKSIDIRVWKQVYADGRRLIDL